MAVCIDAIKKTDSSDLKTPQFIFERLANIIYPVKLAIKYSKMCCLFLDIFCPILTYIPFVMQEDNDQGEFFLSLDKDPLQEDFLQGRMVGNPYSSNEPGLGPLMRDVKNKICRGKMI